MKRWLEIVGCVLLLLLQSERGARAQPWFGWGDNRLEDAFADGDLEEGDLLARAPRLRGRRGRAETWVSVGGVVRQRADRSREWAGVVVVGVPLERLAATASIAAPPRGWPPRGWIGQPAGAGGDVPTPAPLGFDLARGAVVAAWRQAGLDARDVHLDAMAARARWSGLLPEARVRVTRQLDASGYIDSRADALRSYDATGATTGLEARLTWRLDRLLYADDEPTLERIRMDRIEARARIGAQVLEALFRWGRATVERARAPAGSLEAVDAALRVAEHEVLLDVLTGGWFRAHAAPTTPH